MPLSELPQIDNKFRETTTYTYERRALEKNKPSYMHSNCYTITSFAAEQDHFRPSYYFTPVGDIAGSVDKQLALIHFSSQLFANSTPLEGVALSIMNKTSSRLFSKTPTRL